MMNALRFLYKKISSSLRLQFILIVLAGVLAAILAGSMAEDIFSSSSKYYYYPSRMGLEEQLKELASSIQASPHGKINPFLNETSQLTGSKLRIIATDGTVLYRSENATEKKMDLPLLLAKIANQNESPSEQPESREIYALYPFSLHNRYVYLVSSIKSNGWLQTYRLGNPFFSGAFAILAFIFVYILLTGKKMRQLEEVTTGMHEIAKGNFQFRLKERGEDEIGRLATHINDMAKKLEENRLKERKLEQERTELITSLSHDLRTPLTSIIGYLKWIQDGSGLSRNEIVSYAAIALSKSEKLKQMIDNLFDYTKLTHHQVELHTEEISLSQLINQLLEETFALSEQEGLTVERLLSEDPLIVKADPLLLVRMLDNLIHNAIRYGLRPGKIAIETKREGDMAVIQISNSAKPIDPDIFGQLFEMFVTGDKSRSKHGSGIGLAIVKRIVELHRGSIRAVQKNGFITFRIQLPFIQVSDRDPAFLEQNRF